ncbi:AAA family ATPase, partial [Pantoea agglomerans]|nr:AAA family ATPase [Pantoea agglomerans]
MKAACRSVIDTLPLLRGSNVSRTIMLIPTGTSVGLTSVSLGVIRAMER